VAGQNNPRIAKLPREMHRDVVDSLRRICVLCQQRSHYHSARTCEYVPGPTFVSLEVTPCLKRASVDLKADEMATRACGYFGV
jgi:hypothetical protein